MCDSNFRIVYIFLLFFMISFMILIDGFALLHKGQRPPHARASCQCCCSCICAAYIVLDWLDRAPRKNFNRFVTLWVCIRMFSEGEEPKNPPSVVSYNFFWGAPAKKTHI